MADISTRSTDELLAMRERIKAGTSPKSDLASMSTEALLNLRNEKIAKQRVQSEAGAMQDIDNTLRSVARGVPVIGGAMDEVSAGINTGAGLWGDYDQELAYQRERDRAYDEAHPVASTVGQVGGGVAGGVAMLPARLFQGGSLIANTAKGAGAGAGLGAVEGFTRGEGGGDVRLEEAGRSAILGGSLGAAFPMLAKGVGAAWGGVASYLANRGVDAKAINAILTELQRSGATPQQASQRLQQLGPDGMLADLNPGMQAMTGGTAIADAGAANTISTALANRRALGNTRAKAALDKAFGPAQDPFTVRQGTKAAKAAIGSEYEAALANAPSLPRSLDDILAQQLTYPMKDMSLANRKVVGQVFDQVEDALTADTPEIAARRLLDIRKSLDAQIVYDRRALEGLSSADKAGQEPLRAARGVIDEVLKNRIPGFAEADAKFAPIARQQSAFEEGRTKVLRGGPNTMTPAELRHSYSRVTPTENAMRGQGMRSELERQLSNERQNAGVAVDRTLNRDFNREKVGIQVGPSRAQDLARALEREKTFLETSNIAEVGRGSRTAPLSEAARRLWGRGEPSGVIGEMMATGGTVAAFAGPKAGLAAAGAIALKGMLQKAADRLSKPAVEVIRRTAEALTYTGRTRDAFLQSLITRASAIPARQQTAERIEALARGLLGGQAGRLGYESQNAVFGSPGDR